LGSKSLFGSWPSFQQLPVHPGTPTMAVLTLPPLRQRPGDLGRLIELLLEKANETGEKEEPGNVRELENTLMRVTVWTEGPSIGETGVRVSATINRS
jgi:DNA-binding NtrC family response regulator